MRHHRYGRRHGPPPFVRRIGAAFAFLIILTALVARTSAAVAIAGLVVIVAGFAFALTRVARYFRAQDELRRQLMADVAHELRTPLAILQGRVEGLLDGVYPRDDAHLEELLDETRHLGRLVEDVRTLANAEAGAFDLRKERVDLEELVRDATSALGVDVHADHPATLELDPVRMREVLLNVIANALDAGGRVRVDVEGRTIRVSDTGRGIAAEDLPHIFERFVKGSRSHGSGLGLAIARKLVLAHGGTIGVTSEEGVGTTVTIAL